MGDVGQNRSHILSRHFFQLFLIQCDVQASLEMRYYATGPIRNHWGCQKFIFIGPHEDYWSQQGQYLYPTRYHRHFHTAIHTHNANMLYYVIIVIIYLLHTDDHRGSISHLFLANEKRRLAPIVWTALPNGQFIFQWFKRSREREEVIIF